MERTFKLAVSQKRKGIEFSVARPHSVGYHPPPVQSLWLEAISLHEKGGQVFQDSVESCLL